MCLYHNELRWTYISHATWAPSNGVRPAFYPELKLNEDHNKDIKGKRSLPL
jgi:hypothetical protein